MNFREQIYERLLIHLGEADVPRESVEAYASDVIHILDRLTQDRAFEAGVRQVLQRYANEWAEHNSRRIIETRDDDATGVVYEMIEGQARNRAVRALRKVLMDTLEGRERPLDDMDFFEND